MIQRNHTLEEKQLEIKPFYPVLENTASNKLEIPCDSTLFEHIKTKHQHQLQTLTDENKVKLYMDPKRSIVTISPSDKVMVSRQSWQERVGTLENFLHGFKKIEIPIAPELFDEVSQRWQKARSTKEPSTDLILNRHDRLARIIGKKDSVNEEGRKLQELILAVEEDTELMNSIVKVTEDGIPRSRLSLLEMSGICQRLQSKHQHLNISFDLDSGTLCLDGPRNLLKDVQAEVFMSMSKMTEKIIELPTNITNVLKMPSVSNVIQDLLKQRGVQAMFVYDQSNSSNEVQVIGVDSNSTKEAEKVLLGAIQENSIRLTDENAKVLNSRLWRDFHATLISKFKVGIVVQVPSNTVWVSGIAKDAKECYDQVIDFLQKNTILCDTLPLDHGSTRFVFERLSSEVNEIKREFAGCSLDMREASGSKGIEISGTAEGIEKCLPRIVDLTKDIRQVSVPVDKPGMKKFFSQGKGPKSLKTIEDNNHCIIITSERTENEESSTYEAGAKELENLSGEFICSFLTTERKKISVFKNDITKHRVDAIVNPANEELKHIGGLAAAIVKAGGTDIQVHCDKFVEEQGRLLEGRTLVTPAGMLPCDRIIHTVGPKWNSMADRFRRDGKETNQERLLKMAIKNCLKEAESLKSIAIPAVSSGQFGFPRDLCAKVILEAVVQFCRANPSCNLSEIHLVNHDSPTVKVFADEMRNLFGEEQNFTDKEKRAFARFGLGTASNSPRSNQIPKSFTTPEGVCVTVEVGDLAQQQVDVIIKY